MAGPGIRYCHFARELAPRFAVSLLIPNDPAGLPLPGVDIIRARSDRHRQLSELSSRFDVVVAQGGLDVRTMTLLAGRTVRTIYDLYVPFSEVLTFQAERQRAGGSGQLVYRAHAQRQRIVLATGSAFTCANERQRDLLLGALNAARRIRLEDYDGDRTLSGLVAVVPFGLPAEAPRATRRVLKGVLPGIAETDKVLLWGGNIWDWLDPLTPIRAVAKIAAMRDDVKLLFLGLGHPNPAAEKMEMTGRAVSLAERLGVSGTHVFFNFGWIPYEERANYLLEADLGVSAHFDNLETLYAHRTRLLDYFWAGLPTLTTRGDALGDLVAREQLGRALEYEDVDGWVEAILSLLDEGGLYRRLRANVQRVRARFAWPVVVEPLAELVDRPGRPVGCTAGAVARTAEYALLRARISLGDKRASRRA